jgi:hypothetical protein
MLLLVYWQVEMSTELSEEDVQNSLLELEKFCSRCSWKVVYSSKKNNQYKDRVITLCNSHRSEILYYIFLHEIGHAWMIECDFTYAERYPELVRASPRYATVTYKIAKVQEEIEAWDVGKKLAFSLGLKINNFKFEKVRAECLGTYMNWAGRRRNKNYGI